MTTGSGRPRVLILRALGLGDAITGIPALRGLRRRWRTAALTIACPAPIGAWLRDLGLVDDVLPTTGLPELTWTGSRPEVAVNLHGCGPRSHRLLQTLGPDTLVAFRCEAAGVHQGPTWRADEHEVDRWLRLVNASGRVAEVEDLRLRPRDGNRRPQGPVVIHPGAAASSRCWPASRWACVASALARDHEVVVTGTAAEAEICADVARDPRVIDRCGLDDLHGLTRLVGAACVVLSGDTGVAHLATALATPSVTLFGPVAPAVWGPRLDADLHRTLWSPIAAGVPGGSTPLADLLRPGDPHGTELDPRLERIGVADVLDAVAGLPPVRRPAPGT